MAQQQDKLLDLFEEFLIIYKFVNRKQIRDLLQSELNSDQLIEIYQKSDGLKASREIASSLKIKCSHVKIINIWNRWAAIGIVIPATTKGRYKAAFKLEEYGLQPIEDNE